MRVREEVDCLLVYCHAGVEHIPQPLPEWRERYREFVDMGCDGVIASHPHVAQGWEEYKEKPIAYSLGNFYFPKERRMGDAWYKSLCASLTVADSGKVKMEMTPLIFDAETIRVDHSEETRRVLERLNSVLADKERYMRQINSACMCLLKDYDCQFGVGGYFTLRSPKGMMKYAAKKLLGRNPMPGLHLLNNLRCESHRYAISRALKMKDGVQ